MSAKISHSGVIEQIEDGMIHVRIVHTSACAACKVAGYCNAAESKEKVVDVPCDNVKPYRVGQEVVVTTSGSVAAKAMLWAFGLPLVLMVVVLVAVLIVTADEGKAALCGLLALLPYYLLLWLFRDRMRERLAFYLE